MSLSVSPSKKSSKIQQSQTKSSINRNSTSFGQDLQSILASFSLFGNFGSKQVSKSSFGYKMTLNNKTTPSTSENFDDSDPFDDSDEKFDAILCFCIPMRLKRNLFQTTKKTTAAEYYSVFGNSIDQPKHTDFEIDEGEMMDEENSTILFEKMLYANDTAKDTEERLEEDEGPKESKFVDHNPEHQTPITNQREFNPKRSHVMQTEEYMQKVEKNQHFEKLTNPNRTVYYRKNTVAFNILTGTGLLKDNGPILTGTKTSNLDQKRSATKSLLGIVEEEESTFQEAIDQDRHVITGEQFERQMKQSDTVEAMSTRKKSVMYRANQVFDFIKGRNSKSHSLSRNNSGLNSRQASQTGNVNNTLNNIKSMKNGSGVRQSN